MLPEGVTAVQPSAIVSLKDIGRVGRTTSFVDERAKRGRFSWARREATSFFLPIILAVVIMLLAAPFATIAVELSYSNITSYSKEKAIDLNATACTLSSCRRRRLEPDAWLIYCNFSIGACMARVGVAILQSRFLLTQNVWPHTFIGVVLVTLVASLISHATFTGISSAYLFSFSGLTLFFYNLVGNVSRRLAQYRSSEDIKRGTKLVQKIILDAGETVILTLTTIMSLCYLIASERINGIIDILINGVVFPGCCAGFRILFHHINQASLRRKLNRDIGRQLEVASLTSALFELTFTIPAFFVFLRINDWTTFVISLMIAFMIEIFCVHWVTKGKKQFIEKARKSLPLNLKVLKITPVQDLVTKTESALAEVGSTTDKRAAMMLAAKIFHQEQCEKLGMWLAILLTLVTKGSVGKLTSDLSLQILVLVFLEFVVGQVKARLCEGRGILVSRVRVHLLGNVWFTLALASIGIAGILALLCAIKFDCFLYGVE